MGKQILEGNVYKNRNIRKPQKEGGQGGWALGWFASAPFKTKEFEIKLGKHKKGKKKEDIVFNNKAKTLVILIQGKMLTNFYNKKGVFIKKIILKNPGDFNFYNSGIAHNWIFLEKSRTLTIRWPSIKNDQKEITNLPRRQAGI